MIFEKIRDILAKQLELNPAIISLDTNIVEDLGADSLDIVELIMCLESEFDIEITDEIASELLTVSQVVEFIEKIT